MKKDESRFKQLELFQEPEDYKEVFENAKRAKEFIQNKYSKFNDDEMVNITPDKFWIFDFGISITQLSEKPEPDSPKLFIRKYTPTLDIYATGDYSNPIYRKKFTEKVVPKFINEIYVGNSISQDFFYEIAKQYLLLETVDNFLKEQELVELVNRWTNDLSQRFTVNTQAIIHINSKMFGRVKPTPTNPYITATINKINNISNRLKNRTDNIFIGNYLNYIFENELILDLDKNSTFRNDGKISNYFQNDFLLLNNMEFLTELHNTKNWHQFIIPPSFLKINTKSLALKQINDMPDFLFFFQRIQDDGMFYRTELYIPKKYMNDTILKETISISMTFLKQNNTQK